MTSIEGFSKYLIYNNGDVWSLKRKKFLKQRFDKDGYPRLDLRTDDNKAKPVTFTVHRLVGIAYLGLDPTDSNLTIDHIDDDIKNNYLHNLQICTRKQNIMKKKITRKYDLPTGVVFCGKRYKAQIYHNGRFSLGLFNTKEEAGKAYQLVYEKIMKDVKECPNTTKSQKS